MVPRRRNPKNNEQDWEGGKGGEASGQDWEGSSKANQDLEAYMSSLVWWKKKNRHKGMGEGMSYV